MTMKILVIGKNGQVGFELQRSMAVLGDVVAVARERCDLAQPDGIRALVRAEQPDVILNAAAYTAVDKAEQEADLANRMNGSSDEQTSELQQLMRISYVVFCLKKNNTNQQQ